MKAAMLTDNVPETLDRLVTLGMAPDVNIRPVLLRVLVDLFVSRAVHGDEAVRQFAEMALRLLDDADEGVRLTVAEKLAGHAQTPPTLVKRLLAERGAVAGAMLAHAGLDEPTLHAAAVLGTPEMAAAVARRTDLDPTVTRALAERPEGEVVAALAGNLEAPIDLGLQRYLVRRGRDNDALATHLLARGGDLGEMAALFLAADRAGRAEILLALRRQELGRPATEPLPGSDFAREQIAHIALRPGQDGLDLVLCQAFSLPPPVAERIVDDTGGEPLAVALSALGVIPEVAARLFILGPPAIGRSYPRVKALVGLVETLPVGAARRIMASLANAASPARLSPSRESAGDRGGPKEPAHRAVSPLPRPAAGQAARRTA